MLSFLFLSRKLLDTDSPCRFTCCCCCIDSYVQQQLRTLATGSTWEGTSHARLHACLLDAYALPTLSAVVCACSCVLQQLRTLATGELGSINCEMLHRCLTHAHICNTAAHARNNLVACLPVACLPACLHACMHARYVTHHLTFYCWLLFAGCVTCHFICY
jgi:hypothetical protein